MPAANLYLDRACRSLDLHEFALKRYAIDLLISDPKSRGLRNENFLHCFPLLGPAKNGNDCAWPIFLHLDGNEKNVQGAGFEQSFLSSPQDFRGEIVNISLKFGDLLRCFIVFKLAKHCTQNVRPVRQISPSHSIADFLGSHWRQETHRMLELGDDRSAGGSDQLEGNGNLRDWDAFQYFQGRRGG